MRSVTHTYIDESLSTDIAYRLLMQLDKEADADPAPEPDMARPISALPRQHQPGGYRSQTAGAGHVGAIKRLVAKADKAKATEAHASDDEQRKKFRAGKDSGTEDSDDSGIPISPSKNIRGKSRVSSKVIPSHKSQRQRSTK